MGAIFAAVGAVTDAELDQMRHLLAHRGPESTVARHGNQLAVGAIGRDPGDSIATSGDYSIVCDATLYNREALIGLLRDGGYEGPLVSSADIVLAMYRTSGAASLEEIDGDFAFVLVDRTAGDILVGRDYFGCRPLYYSRTPSGTVAFATEYKGLLALNELEPSPDRDMVQYLQHAKRLPVGRTLLRGVYAAPIGGLTRLREDGSTDSVHRFAPLEVNVSVRSETRAVDLIRQRLMEAIRRRSADVETIGLALSGGIDSISLAFLFRRVHPDRTLHTFTAGHGPDDPEVATASKVAEAIGSVHHEVITPPDLVKRRFREMVWHLEDPFARSEALQLHEIARVARGHVDVLFSGQGSDGLFAGAPKYRLLWLMRLLPPLRGGLAEFYHLTQIGVGPVGILGRSMEWAYYRGKLPPVPRVLGCDSRPRAGSLPSMGPEFVNRNMAKGFQAGVCKSMQKFERGFAASGLEYRSPFYDLDLVRSAYTITDKLKIRRAQSKYVFRRALADLVPPEFQELAKFPQRMRYDAAFADALDEVADDVLSPDAVERRGLFEPASIARLRRRTPGRAYPGEAAMRLWTALATEIWARQFLDREAVERDAAGAAA